MSSQQLLSLVINLFDLTEPLSLCWVFFKSSSHCAESRRKVHESETFREQVSVMHGEYGYEVQKIQQVSESKTALH